MRSAAAERYNSLVARLRSPADASAAALDIQEWVASGDAAGLFEANVLPALTAALDTGVHDASLCERVCVSLGLLALAGDGQVSLSFLNRHGAHALTAALQAHPHDADVCVAVSRAIPSVIGGKSPKKFLCDPLVSSGVVPLLAKALIAHMGDERVCAAACSALRALKMRPAHRKDYIRADVPAILTRIIQARPHAAIFADTMHIFLDILADDYFIMPAEMCVAIVDCMSSFTGALTAENFSVLATIARNPNGNLIPRKRIFDVVMNYLVAQRDSAASCLDAMSAFSEFAWVNDPAIRSIILQNGTLGQIYECIRPHAQDANLCEHSTEFISRLLTFSAKEEPTSLLLAGSLSAFISAGTIDLLCAFLRDHPSNAVITLFTCSALASISEEFRYVAPCVSSGAPALICAALEEQRSLRSSARNSHSTNLTPREEDTQYAEAIAEAIRALQLFLTGSSACVDQVVRADSVPVFCSALGMVTAAGAVRTSMWNNSLSALKTIAAGSDVYRDLCVSSDAPAILCQMVAHPAQQDLAIDVIKLLANGTDAQREAVIAAGALRALCVNVFDSIDGIKSAAKCERAMQVFVDVASGPRQVVNATPVAASSTLTLVTEPSAASSAATPFAADVLSFVDHVKIAYRLHSKAHGVCYETARALAFLSDEETLSKYGGDHLLEALFEMRSPEILSAVLHTHVQDVSLFPSRCTLGQFESSQLTYPHPDLNLHAALVVRPRDARACKPRL